MDLIHPELCRARPLPAVNRHNSVVNSIAASLQSTNWTEKEPTLINNPNPRRADIRIGNAAVGAALHPRYGQIDVKIKCILAHDTINARQNTVRAEQETSLNFTYRQIQAALQVTHDQTLRDYEELRLNPPIVPIVIASGGTTHPVTVEFLKTMLPDPEQRRKLRTKISIVLLRARALVFPWPPPE